MKLQVYKDFNEFKNSVIEEDGLTDFKVNVRKINWTLKKRECRECGKTFETKYPAKIFCDTCADKEDKKNKNESVIARINKKRITRNCTSCGNEFILSAPAMRKCENCSETGGELVQ